MKRQWHRIWFPGGTTGTLKTQTIQQNTGQFTSCCRHAAVCFHLQVKLRMALCAICFSISLSTSISASALQWHNTKNVLGRNATSETLQHLVAIPGVALKCLFPTEDFYFRFASTMLLSSFPRERFVFWNCKSPKFFPSTLPLAGSYVYTYWTLLSFFILVDCITPHAVCLPLAASPSLSRWVLRWDDLLR